MQSVVLKFIHLINKVGTLLLLGESDLLINRQRLKENRGLFEPVANIYAMHC